MELGLHLGLQCSSVAVPNSRELGKMHKKSCSPVQMARPYKRHCPLEDMFLLQGMNQIFTVINSVLF